VALRMHIHVDIGQNVWQPEIHCTLFDSLRLNFIAGRSRPGVIAIGPDYQGTVGWLASYGISYTLDRDSAGAGARKQRA